MRGNAKDYDNWAAMGNSGWSFKDVLPYFKKLEDMKHEKLINGKYIRISFFTQLSIQTETTRYPKEKMG